MDGRAAIEELSRSLPEGTVATDPDVIATYLQDWSRYPEVGRPLGLVRPACAAEIQEVLRWASSHHVPVVPRGAGSGLSGGATAVEGGILLCTERMRSVAVDPAMRVATAEAGALNAEVKAAAAAHGLWYPPDPSSFEMCSIGGNVATNAGGMCCVKYGVTSDYVLGMRVVLADGTLVTLGGPRLKDSAGLSLTKLFVGSEGTLGVVADVTLRLLPAPPPASTVVAAFASLDRAVAAVLALLSTVRPATLELMDRVSINAVEDALAMDLDRSAEALLVARSDVSAAEAAKVVATFEEAGATEVYATDDADEGEAFLAARRAVIPALDRMGDLLIEDVGVPIPKLPELVAGIGEIAARYDVTVALYAHVGDGNTHPTIVYDGSDPAGTARARAAFGAIMDLAISLGGTITGEHGTGRYKRPWLAAYLGDDVMELSRRIKEALDPDGILNPGVMF
ncbi:MAG TPA: FAD-linked oxidase C-terminal domain-containing protein [Acidimicrobiales bacterium]|nr:FAD-linked oxidase C-terminal domain-containing protein [Acidimicrobiales bacterium]